MSGLAMFCFGVASAYGSMLLIVHLPAWLHDRKRKKLRGRAYWDAILLEDQRKREIGESYEL